MEDFKKAVRLGSVQTYNGREMSVYCVINWKDGRLSITGVEGPLKSGNCLGGFGQIEMHMDDEYLRGLSIDPKWTMEKVCEFLRVWREWHLNDCTAGSPKQESFLKKFPGVNTYDAQCGLLKFAGIHLDTDHERNGEPYQYGTAWLYRDVPGEVLEFLKSLPEAPKVAPWY